MTRARSDAQPGDAPRLQLWFEHEELTGPNETIAVALTKSHFESMYQGQKIVADTDRYKDKKVVPWTNGVMAHMWYLVKCAADAQRFSQNGANEIQWAPATKGSPIKSIHELATKASDWREWMFGDLGRVPATRDSVGIKQLIPDRQMNHKPHRRLNEKLLPAKGISVFLDNEPVTSVVDLERLASNILTQFEDSRRSRGRPNEVSGAGNVGVDLAPPGPGCPSILGQASAGDGCTDRTFSNDEVIRILAKWKRRPGSCKDAEIVGCFEVYSCESADKGCGAVVGVAESNLIRVSLFTPKHLHPQASSERIKAHATGDVADLLEEAVHSSPSQVLLVCLQGHGSYAHGFVLVHPDRTEHSEYDLPAILVKWARILTGCWDRRLIAGVETCIPRREFEELEWRCLAGLLERFEDRLDPIANGRIGQRLPNLDPRRIDLGKIITESCLHAVADVYAIRDVEDLNSDSDVARKSNLFYSMVVEVWSEVVGIGIALPASTAEFHNLKSKLADELKTLLSPLLRPNGRD